MSAVVSGGSAKTVRKTASRTPQSSMHSMTTELSGCLMCQASTRQPPGAAVGVMIRAETRKCPLTTSCHPKAASAWGRAALDDLDGTGLRQAAGSWRERVVRGTQRYAGTSSVWGVRVPCGTTRPRSGCPTNSPSRATTASRLMVRMG